jgi:hypothetical protein
MPSIHQVNHPGKELHINYRSRKKNSLHYYFFPDSNQQGVRLWNKCTVKNKPNSHKRKFIEHGGKYIRDVSKPIEKSGLLRFWGEYEGFSRFELLSSQKNTPYWNNPSAIHFPFFFKDGIDEQNTDPYVFGDNLYYATCKKSFLKNIKANDLIAFGSEFGKRGFEKFYLDTLFIVQDELPSIADASIFDEVYIESTLRRIGVTENISGNLPVHVGRKFSVRNTHTFSFFPAKVSNATGFGRPVLDTARYGLKIPGARTGTKSRVLRNDESIDDIWNDIALEVVSQGFVLGTHANPINEVTDLNLLIPSK